MWCFAVIETPDQDTLMELQKPHECPECKEAPLHYLIDLDQYSCPKCREVFEVIAVDAPHTETVH